MKTSTVSKSCTSVAARIAGEDIQRGDFVTVLNEIIELPSFLWCCSSPAVSIDEPVRTRTIPHDAGQPLKVVAVCLPFVYTRAANGKLLTLDTRRQQLVRLERKTVRSVWTSES